ncbi:TPA: hypothetical protein ACGF4I_003493, partial [Vibrio cholerae]
AYSVEKIRQNPKHRNAYKPWSSHDDELLMKMHSEGASIPELCDYFGRQRGGITSRLRKLGLL